MHYNYKEAVKDDVREYIDNEINLNDYEDRDDLGQDLNDKLFSDDSVTGNASGSYTFSSWKAEEYLCHNWDLLGEALEEFGCDGSYITEKGSEVCDVTIRCYLLPEAIREVLDELEADGELIFGEEEDHEDVSE